MNNRKHTLLEWLLATLIYTSLIYGVLKIFGNIITKLYNYFNPDPIFIIVLFVVSILVALKIYDRDSGINHVSGRGRGRRP